MSMVSFLIWLLILVLVFGTLFWVIGLVGLPDPWRKVALALLALIFILILIGALLGHVPLPALRL